MEELRKILEELHPEIDFDTCDTLIDDQYLDSLDVVTLVVELSENFGIDIPPQEIVAKNFNSLKALQEMVDRLA